MADDNNYRVWIGGLHSGIEEEEIRSKCEKYGEIKKVIVRSSHHDTFAFLQFTKDEDCEAAIEALDNSETLGEKVRAARATADNSKRKRQQQQQYPQNNGENRRRDDSRGPPRHRDDYHRRDDRDRDDYRRDDRRDDRGHSRGRDDRGHSRGGRDDYRDRDDRGRRGDSRGRRGGGGGRSPPPRGRSGGRGREPSPRDRRDERRGDRSRSPRRGGDRSRSPRRDRSRSRGDRDRGRDDRGKIPQGRYKITVENIPEDMSWLELKDLGRDYGPSISFARTYNHRSVWYGMLEFKDRDDADKVIKELDNRRVQGSSTRLKAYLGNGPGGD